METTQLPKNKWVDNITTIIHIHTDTQNRLLLSCKKRWNYVICCYTDGTIGIKLSRASQKERNKYRMMSLLCGIWKEHNKGIIKG